MNANVIGGVDIAREAGAARGAIVALVHSMAQFAMPAPNVRNVASTKLARASMDYGIALCVLGESAPDDLGAPLISLHRMQMEHVIRSAFFGGPATEEELKRFVVNDEMPTVLTANGRKRRLSITELTERVEPFFDTEGDGKVTRVVRSHYGLISGVVHGGRDLLALYGEPGQPIGFSVDKKSLVQIIDHAVSFAHLATIVVAKSAVDSPERFSELMLPHFQAIKAYVARQQARVYE
ncbi:hypothetical protein L2Y94_14970 [Luteibacter aegosomatis]|uniref:hypothetical protein n=1 Tax=Luteibacter aegosomatis TaxID=2911537 RepID=UPI001FFAD048|nr:hypothetical protein [Luteibacter aegosomatis]UPG84622.1 hypothetical protein L2Y94_14970 [Luteibacter aegosomatis]